MPSLKPNVVIFIASDALSNVANKRKKKKIKVTGEKSLCPLNNIIYSNAHTYTYISIYTLRFSHKRVKFTFEILVRVRKIAYSFLPYSQPFLSIISMDFNGRYCALSGTCMFFYFCLFGYFLNNFANKQFIFQVE